MIRAGTVALADPALSDSVKGVREYEAINNDILHFGYRGV